jgi:hypothetical protein
MKDPGRSCGAHPVTSKAEAGDANREEGKEVETDLPLSSEAEVEKRDRM